MKLEYATKTDIGKKRDHNEDSHGVINDKDLFFVCDGMGGHTAGDYASQKVVDTITQLIKKSDAADVKKIVLKETKKVPYSARLLSSMVMLANRRLFRLAVMYPKLRGMGTTFTSIYFDAGHVNIVNVGDSRVYRLRDDELLQLSVDHSWVEELRQDGEIQVHEIDNFHESNVITRAMGTGADCRVDWKGCEIKSGDIYLLCSDGLSGEIKDDNIKEILKRNNGNLDQAATELINAANDAGGSDNTTIILVKVNEEVGKVSDIKMNDIVTLSPTSEVNTLLDTYIDKNYPLAKEKVPRGVTREKRFHKNPIFIALVAVIIIFAVLVLIKQPWIEKNSVETSNLTQGDLLVRTVPARADVKLYKEDKLLEQKLSPADFLSLAEGEYRIEIEKVGYEKMKFLMNAVKGKQEIRAVILTAQAKIQMSLGLSPGFNFGEEIFIDEKLCEYYGKPLTVQRIGVVGKTLSVERGRNHTIRVGKVKKILNITEKDDLVKVKLDNGKILLNE